MPVGYSCKICGYESDDAMKAYKHTLASGHKTFKYKQTFTKKEDEQLKREAIKRLRNR